MDARIGDQAQKEKTLKMCSDAGMEIKETLGGNHVQVFDGDVKVVSIARLNAKVFSFLYNPDYWNGL